MVGGGVGAGVAGAQQPGQGFPAGDLGAVQKRQQRMEAERLLPGRQPRLLVVGVIDDQGGIDVDVQPPRSGGAAPAAHAAPARGPRRPDPGQVRGVDPLIDQPPHRGRRGLRAEDVLTIAAELSDPVDAVRAVGDRGGQIGEHLTGGVHPRAAVGVGQRGGDLRR